MQVVILAYLGAVKVKTKTTRDDSENRVR